MRYKNELQNKKLEVGLEKQKAINELGKAIGSLIFLYILLFGFCFSITLCLYIIIGAW